MASEKGCNYADTATIGPGKFRILSKSRRKLAFDRSFAFAFSRVMTVLYGKVLQLREKVIGTFFSLPSELRTNIDKELLEFILIFNFIKNHF